MFSFVSFQIFLRANVLVNPSMLPSAQAVRDDWKYNLKSRFHHLEVLDNTDRTTWTVKGPWTEILQAQNCLESWCKNCEYIRQSSISYNRHNDEGKTAPDITSSEAVKREVGINKDASNELTREPSKHSKRLQKTNNADIYNNTDAKGYRSIPVNSIHSSASSSGQFEHATTNDSHDNLTTSKNYASPLLNFPLPNGTNIYLYMADITKLRVGAIVNAANERLRHGGGVAGAIARAAGPLFQQESDTYVRNHGKVPLSDVVLQPAGPTLPCKYVIHAVGPMWNSFTNKEKCKNILTCTFLKSFQCASEQCKVSSVAVPPISSGTNF